MTKFYNLLSNEEQTLFLTLNQKQKNNILKKASRRYKFVNNRIPNNDLMEFVTFSDYIKIKNPKESAIAIRNLMARKNYHDNIDERREYQREYVKFNYKENEVWKQKYDKIQKKYCLKRKLNTRIHRLSRLEKEINLLLEKKEIIKKEILLISQELDTKEKIKSNVC